MLKEDERKKNTHNTHIQYKNKKHKNIPQNEIFIDSFYAFFISKQRNNHIHTYIMYCEYTYETVEVQTVPPTEQIK